MTRAQLAAQLRDLASLVELAGTMPDEDMHRSLRATAHTLNLLVHRLQAPRLPDPQGPAPATDPNTQGGQLE